MTLIGREIQIMSKNMREREREREREILGAS